MFFIYLNSYLEWSIPHHPIYLFFKVLGFCIILILGTRGIIKYICSPAGSILGFGKIQSQIILALTGSVLCGIFVCVGLFFFSQNTQIGVFKIFMWPSASYLLKLWLTASWFSMLMWSIFILQLFLKTNLQNSWELGFD